ncbi:MAG: dTDP-glucose 4,6-dehydratase, partial [Ignavibacteria bacterium]|nr:dTDP-glucose 4,6-dehydratase [Ignavibacteria bacterium]
VRDWLFAPVTCECIEFLLEKGINGEAYNLAANHNPEITNKKAAELICKILDVSADDFIDYIPDPRPNHDFRYALNTEKLRKLGFKPSVDLIT